jgi:hypothetical protein
MLSPFIPTLEILSKKRMQRPGTDPLTFESKTFSTQPKAKQLPKRSIYQLPFIPTAFQAFASFEPSA